jgi:hemerythrin-like domain-containing protein
MTPIETLKAEHGIISVMLKILSRMVHNLREEKSINWEHADQVLDFLTGFIDENHHVKEEMLFFPSMEKAGISRDQSQISIMMVEHHSSRLFLFALQQALQKIKSGNQEFIPLFIKHANEYIDLKSHHTDKENKIVFSYAEESMPPEATEELHNQFQIFLQSEIRQGNMKRYQEMLQALSHEYLKQST